MFTSKHNNKYIIAQREENTELTNDIDPLENKTFQEIMFDIRFMVTVMYETA